MKVFNVELLNKKTCNVIASSSDTFGDKLILLFHSDLNLKGSTSNIAAIFDLENVVSVKVISEDFDLPELEDCN